ncbi:MAG: PilZ domain-containing protein [Rhizorhabdus sp.]
MSAPLLDRRADPRRTVLLKAMVLPVAGYAVMRIVNASRTGFGGETIASLQAGRPLIFSVEDNRFHQGTVRWTRGQKFGVDLDDAFGILGCSPEVDSGFLASHTARARRYPIERAGRIVMGSLSYRATVRDISQSGMRLELEAELNVGQQVIVRLPDRPLILATVRWCANQMAGIETAERIQTLRLVYGIA